MDTLLVFSALNEKLEKQNTKREFYICGAAALIALRVITRATQDVDVLKPVIDDELKTAAKKVASTLQLKEGWLNNGPALLANELPRNWELRCSEVFRGTHLKVHSIGRKDLIYSKLYAAADRMDDVNDLVALKPNMSELEDARLWVLERDASEIWPKIVDECLSMVKKKLGYEK
ncbi:MAG: hypothetical protein HY843_01450 [Bdellovibrio sp.]|nr:hypothetical protein [Bdellovibrio sp.]